MKNIIKKFNHPILIYLLKFSFVFLILYFLYSKNLVTPRIFSEMYNHLNHLIYAFLLFVLAFFLATYRLYILLRSISLKISIFQTLHIQIIGGFFNIALPGAISGDIIKSYYLKKFSENSTTKAFGILILDRIIGVSAMVFTSTLALFSSFIVVDSPHITILRSTLLLLSVSMFLFYLYLFLVKEEKDLILKYLYYFEKKFLFISKIKNLYLSVKMFHNEFKSILFSLFISIGIQTVVGFSCYQMALILGESSLNQIQLYAIVPIGLIVTAVPLFPGGIGTGHAAFSFLFNLMGSNRGADVFSIFSLFSFFLGSLCGLYYLFSKKEIKLKEK